MAAIDHSLGGSTETGYAAPPYAQCRQPGPPQYQTGSKRLRKSSPPTSRIKACAKPPSATPFSKKYMPARVHFDVEELYAGMKERNLQVSRATVYNTLDLLVEQGLVSKHQFGRNLAQYEKSYGYRQHDHVILYRVPQSGRVLRPPHPRHPNDGWRPAQLSHLASFPKFVRYLRRTAVPKPLPAPPRSPPNSPALPYPAYLTI